MYAINKSIKLLNSKAINLSVATAKGKTALHAACKQGFLECAKFLVSIGIPCEATTIKGITALGTAAQHNHLDIVKFLQYKKCSLTNCGNTNEQNTPLLLACKQHCLSVIKYLIQFKEVTEQAYRFECSPLIQCIHLRMTDIVNLLKDFDSITKLKDSSGRNALHEVARYGIPEHVTIIHPICKYIEDNNGNTSMIESLLSHNFDVADMFMTLLNITPLEKSTAGFNIISLLSQKYDSDIVAYLKSKNLYNELVSTTTSKNAAKEPAVEDKKKTVSIDDIKPAHDILNKTPLLSQRSVLKKEKDPVPVIKASMESKRLLPSLERNSVEIISTTQIAYPKPHNYYSTISNRLMRDFGNAFTLERQPIKETEVLLHEVQSKFQSILSSSKPYATPVKKQKKQLLEALRRKNSKY